MKLSLPKQITFWISVVLALLGLVSSFITIPVVSGLAIWFVFGGFALLVAGLFVKGL